MSSEPLKPASSSPRVPPRAATFAIGAFSAGAVACLSGYLLLAASGPWIGGPPQRLWTAEVLAVTRGSAQLGAQGLSVLAPDATGTVVISINQTGFRSKDYPVIAWDAVDVIRSRRRSRAALEHRLHGIARLDAGARDRGRTNPACRRGWRSELDRHDQGDRARPARIVRAADSRTRRHREAGDAAPGPGRSRS